MEMDAWEEFLTEHPELVCPTCGEAIGTNAINCDTCDAYYHDMGDES
jgi:hypothetical protein